jgi:hypothetical protein
MAHTQGLWQCGLPADGGSINVYNDDSMALRICRVDSDTDFGNHAAANARLIAAAPDMLQVLRRAALALAFAAESSPAMQDDYEAVSAAIAKATA